MIRNGDCLTVLKTLDDNSVDSLVTDPPYFLTNDGGSGFMGKEWDSLSPANAIAESYFRLAHLDLNTVEADAALAPASTRRTQKPSAAAKNSGAQSAESDSIEPRPNVSQSTHSAHALVITKAEALVLCGEWCPALIALVAKLPSHARFVAPCSLTGASAPKNIVRTVADILCADPAWLAEATRATSTGRTESERSSSGQKIGTISVSKSISATSGPANAASESATATAFSVTTSSRSEFLEITKRITSSPSVKAVIRECTKSPNCFPILSEVFHRRWAREVFRVLKPGAHGLVFAGTRTYHRLVSALEDEGFQLRDCLQWIFGSGFPKSLNVAKAGAGKEWEGWGTALKPAYEPIALVRKPLSEKTVAKNVLKWGTGALNIDGCRIEGGARPLIRNAGKPDPRGEGFGGKYGSSCEGTTTQGRFPSHLVLSCTPYCDEDSHDIECAIRSLDEQSGTAPAKPGRTGRKGGNAGALGAFGGSSPDAIGTWPADAGGGASRFFYCAKVSSSERNAGLEGMEKKEVRRHGDTGPSANAKPSGQKALIEANTHPTVKPQKLMRYLCRMVTPPGGVVLDPFTGSGSTGVAAISEGFQFLGIEREKEYVEIANKRIYHALPEFKKQVKKA